MNNFVQAITSSPDVAVIAEYKRASPSLGDINLSISVEEAINRYEAAGAKALSILTNEGLFKGHIDFISRAKSVTRLPILRKDFITDVEQIKQSKQAGADAILLIAGQLSDHQLHHLISEAHDLALATLLEVHTQTELERALQLDADMIGVNSRNLSTLQIDLNIFDQIIDHIPNDVIVVAESGLHTDDLSRLKRLGYDAALIGTSLMQSL